MLPRSAGSSRTSRPCPSGVDDYDLARGTALTLRDEVVRGRRLPPEGGREGKLRLLGARSTMRSAIGSCRLLRRHPARPRTGWRAPARAAAGGDRRAGHQRRPAARPHEDDVIAGAPARADGLRRRAPGRAAARSSASRACSACSRRRRSPSARPVRRCCIASCARCWTPSTCTEGSHDYKVASALFDSFPKEELFAAPVDDLRRAVVALTGLEGSDRVRLLGRRDADGRSASPTSALPRSRYSPTLGDPRASAPPRGRFATDGVEAHHVLMVRLHFLVHAAGGLPDIPLRELEAEVVALAGVVGRRAAEQPRRAPRRRTGAHAGGRAVAAVPGALQGLHEAGAGGGRRRELRAARRGRVVRGQPDRSVPSGRCAWSRQGRRQIQALRGDADALEDLGSVIEGIHPRRPGCATRRRG